MLFRSGNVSFHDDRILIWTCVETFFSAPVLALVDGDPYGIDILSVYKYGSRSLQHESTKLAAGRIKWLGLWSSELDECAFSHIHLDCSHPLCLSCSFGIDRDRLLPITNQDEKKVSALSLQSSCLRSNSRCPAGSFYAPNTWYAPKVEVCICFLGFGIYFRSSHTDVQYTRKELMHMLHSRRKAEIEILTTMRPDRPADNPQWVSPDRHQQLEAVSILHCSPYDDATGGPANGRMNSHFSDYSNTVSSANSLITSIPTSLCYSDPVADTSSSPTPVYRPTPPAHAPLLRYLVRKIADFVAQAEARANAMEIDARSL
jgi:meiotic recombination protein SPO11